MPSYQTLLLPPSYPIQIDYDFLEITREYAGGHDKSELVGPTNGIMLVTLSFNHLPAAGLTVNDPENSNAATPWSKYLVKFFKYRKADGAPFTISVNDPETETTMTQLFKFPPRLSIALATYKLYTSQGLTLRQWRALT